MSYATKIVLHCRHGQQRSIEALVAEFMKSGVIYVGVVGKDAARIEGIIDDICIGDGSAVYEMLTASHEDETLQDAINLAEQLSGEFAGPVQVVELQ